VVEVFRLEQVPLRDVWPNEARDFTPWMAANVDALAETLGMDLELEGSEVAVGPFSADILLRESASDSRVVVENLLEATDHDHLGKMLTYAAGLEASYAVLVAKKFRPEHRSVLNWLNDISNDGSGFFGVEVHAVRIGESPPAVNFDLVVAPDDWSRQVRARTTSTQTETTSRYQQWWAEFLPAFHERFPGWSNASIPPAKSWTNFPSGRSEMKYGLSFSYGTGATNYSIRAELYLDDGALLLPQFEAHREQIETDCGFALSWEGLENSRASRIAIYLDPADPSDTDQWERFREWSFDHLAILRRVLQPHIEAVKT